MPDSEIVVSNFAILLPNLYLCNVLLPSSNIAVVSPFKPLTIPWIRAELHLWWLSSRRPFPQSARIKQFLIILNPRPLYDFLKQYLCHWLCIGIPQRWCARTNPTNPCISLPKPESRVQPSTPDSTVSLELTPWFFMLCFLREVSITFGAWKVLHVLCAMYAVSRVTRGILGQADRMTVRGWNRWRD